MPNLILFVVLAGLFIFIIKFRLKVRRREGVLSIKGVEFDYVIGDRLIRFVNGAQMHGIDVSLPKEMPHIFLDGHTNNHGLGTRYFMDKKQRISLEGDFDRYFQAYVPTQYKSLALSILSPDVLQTIIRAAGDYDVEIYGSHVRVISRSRVFNKPKLEKELLEIADVVMKEVAHRLRSWSDHDSQNAHKAYLNYYESSEVAFGADNKNVIYSSLIMAAFSSFFYWTGYQAQKDNLWKYALVNYGIGLFLFPGCLIMIRLMGKREGIRSR